MAQTKWRKLLKTINSSLPERPPGHYHCSTILQRMFSARVNHSVDNPKLFKPLAFTLGMTITSFSGCAILQYERAKDQSVLSNYWERLKHRKNENFSEKAFSFRKQINKWWNSLDEGHRIAAGLIGINLLTFGVWQLRPCHPFMRRWFTQSPYNKRSSTLLLSCFSHSEFWHLGANMFVLWSFSPLIHSIMGSEQFIAFYITGGCVSSLVSHCFKLAVKSRIPSLGASGALLAVLAACCVEAPDARLSIIFLPFLTFSAKTALTAIITVDVCGILFRWQLFDHACHLGGSLFGCWYVLYGRQWTWNRRAPVMRKWHEIRKSFEEK